jgi:hypothetical protein
MKNKLTYVIVASSLACSVNASVFLNEQFETYIAGSNMNGQGGWTVSNGLGGVDAVVIADSYTWDGTNGSATIGGIVPDNVLLPTTLSHAVSLPLQTETSHVTTVRFELAFTESSDVLKRNSFSVAVDTDAGNLLTVSFAPLGAGYGITWSSAFATGSFLGVFSESQPTEFTMTTYNDGGTMKYSLSNVGVPVVTGGTLGGGALPTTLINNISATWNGNSAGGPGDGSFTIDRVVAIPEPSSVLLLGLSALGFIRRKR